MGKGRVLTAKEVNIGIAKLLKKKEDEKAAAVRKAERTEGKKTRHLAKAAQEALYQTACDAALASGLPRPKKPRKPRAPRAPQAAQAPRSGGRAQAPPAAACVPVCAAARPETHSGHEGNPAEVLPGWEDCAELDELGGRKSEGEKDSRFFCGKSACCGAHDCILGAGMWPI